MTPTIFVGIDISKLTLDVAVIKDGILVLTKKIKNSAKDITEFLGTMRTEFRATRGKTVYCAEHMGIYAKFMKEVFLRSRARICFESPLQIWLSMGIQREKNDVLDAIRIAEYARKNLATLKFWAPPRSCIETLGELRSARKKLLKMRAMMQSTKTVESYFLSAAGRRNIGQYTHASFQAINADLKVIEAEMAEIVDHDDRLRELVELITSVPHIGKVIALEIVILTNEFRDFSCPKKFASFCGIAPFSQTSGTSVNRKPKISSIGNMEMKRILHLAAMGSARPGKSSFKTYYARKLAEGKNKMCVLNAIRNKLVRVIFACVRDKRPYEERVSTS
jgi:transposase